MSNSERPFVCAIRGPIMLIAIGGLFAVSQFTPYSIHRTWPVLLILLGLLKLFERFGDSGQAPGPIPPAGVAS